MDRAHNCPPGAVDVNGCEIACTVWKNAVGEEEKEREVRKR